MRENRAKLTKSDGTRENAADRGLAFRRANEEDLDRLVEIHLAAYPDARSVDARRRNFTQNPYGRLGDLVVVEDRGRVVGHAFLFSFRAFFGGASVKVGGVASVAVAPEARGRGVATELMAHLHRRADRRGDVVTVLYAFRQGFYARLGYATTSSRKRLAIDARSIPASWRALARARVRGLREGDDRTLRSLHARAAEKATGWLARPRRLWETLLSRETRMALVCERPGKHPNGPVATGYAAFSFVQQEPHAETLLEVDELVAVDDETRRALLGALACMRDQVSEILLEVAVTDPLERALVDCDGRRYGTEVVEHSLGEIVGGPMVRVVDVPRALAARGYRGTGSFDLIVGPDDGEDAPTSVSVRVRAGRATIAPRRSTRGPRALETTRAGLAAIFYGGLSARDAIALGLAEADASVADRIDGLAAMPPLTPLDAF